MKEWNMRFSLILLSLITASCWGQTTTTGQAETNGFCSPAITGSDNTVTITCSKIDKKLAEQIGQLVAESKRDGKALRDISDKLDILLKEHDDAPAVRVNIERISQNVLKEGPGAPAYESKWRITLNGVVPRFQNLTAGTIGFIPEGGGTFQALNWKEGGTAIIFQNASGPYILTIQQPSPSTVLPRLACSGVRCVGPS